MISDRTRSHTRSARGRHTHTPYTPRYAVTLRVRHLSVTAMRAYACCWMCEVRREVLRLLVCRFGAIRARCAARDSRSAARARERACTHAPDPRACAALVAAVRNALAAPNARVPVSGMRGVLLVRDMISRQRSVTNAPGIAKKILLFLPLFYRFL